MDRKTKEMLLADSAFETKRRLLEFEARQKFKDYYASLSEPELEQAWWDEWMPDRFVKEMVNGKLTPVVLSVKETMRRRKMESK